MNKKDLFILLDKIKLIKENTENIMTLKEYDKQVNILAEKFLNTENDYDRQKAEDELAAFQNSFMLNVLLNIKKNANTEAKNVIYNLLHYAVYNSCTGNAIVYVSDVSIANEIEDIIWEEIGDYLLDYEIYEEYNHWVVDCMFAGNYVPYWDGWLES